MPKIELPGHVIFAFSVEEKENARYYHIIYDEKGDMYKDHSQLAGGIYKLLQDYPYIMEDLIFVMNAFTKEMNDQIKSLFNNEKKA